MGRGRVHLRGAGRGLLERASGWGVGGWVGRAGEGQCGGKWVGHVGGRQTPTAYMT